MVEIPSGVILAWQDSMDAFLSDGFAHTVTLVYPPIIQAGNAPNDSIGQKPSNHNLFGRPVPSFGMNENGPSSSEDMIEVEQTEQVKMRVYFLNAHQISKNKQLETAGITWPTTVIQTKFWMKDMNKLLKAVYLRLDADESLRGFREYRFTMVGEPVPIGFVHNRYGLATWSRSQ